MAPAVKMDVAKLRPALDERVDGEVRFDPGTLSAYAQDASNYRQVPIGVVVPRTVDAGAEAVAVCRENGAPVLSRGGGTSLAGQCVNTAIVIDWTKYCHRLVSFDKAARTAIVQPGMALDKVNDALAPHGLMVGPKPSTHVSCTIGGMIGNNSCGSTAQAYGKMADSVRGLRCSPTAGCAPGWGRPATRTTSGLAAEGGDEAVLYRRLREIRECPPGRDPHRLPEDPAPGVRVQPRPAPPGERVPRGQGPGRQREHAGHRAARGDRPVRGAPAPVPGRARLPGHRASRRRRTRAVRHNPLAVEGLDDTLISLEREEHLAGDALDKLPAGSGWLFIQFGADTEEEAQAKAHALIDDVNSDGDHPKPHVAYVDDPAVEDKLNDVREAGLGATAYPPGKHETHEGWEDAAVPPDRLGDYLRDFRELLERYDYRGASLYGHFGQGCVHTRIPFELRTDEGIAHYRAFVEDAADLVVGYGGSLSGEHGDGQSRGELLVKMFGPDLIGAFGELKAAFDPGNRMNPGKIVEPNPLDSHLTRRGWFPKEPLTLFHYAPDGGKFSRAASRCVGVGKCRGDEGAVMCPSYRVTREEEHSTRGRSRLLMEMVRGEVIRDGWHSTEVRDALDLCLACKGCRKDCPVEVDMATYKAEFLAHHYKGRLRPASHYSMGWLPGPRFLPPGPPGLVNAAGRPGPRRLAKAPAALTSTGNCRGSPGNGSPGGTPGAVPAPRGKRSSSGRTPSPTASTPRSGRRPWPCLRTPGSPSRCRPGRCAAASPGSPPDSSAWPAGC